MRLGPRAPVVDLAVGPELFTALPLQVGCVHISHPARRVGLRRARARAVRQFGSEDRHGRGHPSAPVRALTHVARRGACADLPEHSAP